MFAPSPHDPFLPPAWRWERARWLREKGKYARRSKEDEWLVQAKAYQSAREKCVTELDLYELSLKYPGIYYAERIYNEDRKQTRWAIEARILARQPFEELAEIERTSTEVLLWYEKLFFNVLPYIDSFDYITNVVMGESVHHGLKERDYDLLWKMYGYAGGPYVLDALIRGFNNPQHCTSYDQVRAWLRDDYRFTVERRAAITGRTNTINNFTCDLYMSNWAKLLEIERTAQGGNSSEAEALIMENIREMMRTIPFSVNREYRGVDATVMRRYDEAGAELRASELIAVSLGRETEEIKAIPTLTFPEASKDVGQANQQGG